MSYGGPTYTYYKNIFGDILGIFDENGTLVVRYYYDAWGNIISTTGSMASTLGRDNPFRYRGYYYDTETGFYYLNARYYNSELGRFISADPVLDTSNAIGCNMFAYCDNNPVNKVDYTGEDAIWLQDKDGVLGFGHTGLLIQDADGTWLHFYWGNDRSYFSGKIGYGDVVSPYDGELSLDAINQFYTNGEGNGYEDMLYFKGDFTKSAAFVKVLQKIPIPYFLISINCVQMSKMALSFGEFTYFDSLYQSVLDTDGIIPNVAYLKIKPVHRAEQAIRACVRYIGGYISEKSNTTYQSY